MRRLVIAGTMLVMASPLAAAETCMTLDPKSVAALFDDWNFSLSSLDADQVVQRYWPNAVLLPTVSNTPRTSAAMIGDYFQHFLARRPRGRIDTRTIQSGCSVAMDVGTYTFSLMDDKGAISEVAARYTFVYQYRDGAWKILHHHSSAMPESGTAVPPAGVQVAIDKTAQPERPARNVEPVPSEPRPKAAIANQPKVKEVARPTTKSKPLTEPIEPPVAELKTSMFANLTSSLPPSKFYPAEAGKRKERGNVNLRVCADNSGAVAGEPEVVKSSGSRLLDEAAQTWARAAKWVPATLNRRRVEGCTQVEVAFEPAA